MDFAEPKDSLGQGVLFVTRSPVIHQAGGSTSMILNLQELLITSGAKVTMLVTMAYGRSPRVGFRQRIPLPAGVKLLTPGYFRIGSYYLRPYALKPWARDISRAALSRPWMRPAARLAQMLWGDNLYCNAWDLTPATKAEVRLAQRVVKATHATTVIANYAMWAPLFESMGVGPTKRIILMHDLLSARVRSILSAGEALDTSPLEESTEMQWLSTADYVIAAQAREVEYVRSHLSTPVLQQPIVLKSLDSSPVVDANRCLFVATASLPNVSGFKYFLQKVWPLIREKNPAAKLAVAGSICKAEIEGFDAAGILKLGFVPSLATEYECAAVCVVPLNVGSGIKIKLLEAISFGKAVVSTSVGVQGLEDWADGAIAVADEPAAFADAVLEVLASEEKRKALERGATSLVREHFALDSAAPQAFLRMHLGLDESDGMKA